jgi:large subunit ribosomal protein L18
MKKEKRKTIQRKKRHRRVKKKLRGDVSRPRLVVYRSLNHIYAQVVNDVSGKTLLSLSSLSKEVRSKSEGEHYSKTDKSKIVGQMLAEKCLDKGIKKVVFDRDGYKYHGRIKALAEGAREGGLNF